MKKSQNYIIPLLVCVSLMLSSCFDEKEDEYTIVGGVATIPVFSVPNAVVKGTTRPGVTAGENLTVSIRYYSEHVPATQYRIYQNLADGNPQTLIYTENIGDFDIKNSYADTFAYTMPALAVGKRPKLIIEIDTENGLTNKRELEMQIIP